MFVSRRQFLICLVPTSLSLRSSEFLKFHGLGSSSMPKPVGLARKLFSNDRSLRHIRERYVSLYPLEAGPEMGVSFVDSFPIALIA